MNKLSIINSAFQKHIRNHIPVTHLAVSDQGEVNLAVPDAYETRLYRLISISLSGGVTEIGTFSVEKTSIADLSANARTLVVATLDDLYAFRDLDKTRLFPNSRAIYTGISVSAAGDYIAAGMADMIASTHLVVMARPSGSNVWMKSLPYSITCVRISADASSILVGSEDGIAVMLDQSRKVRWKLEVADPIAKIAVTPKGDTSVICSRNGTVQGVGYEGNRLWESVCRGSVVDCAISDDAQVVLIARDTEDGRGLLEFCSPKGTPVVDFKTNQRIHSIACSPNGRFAAVSCKDGTFHILEMTQALSTVLPDKLVKTLYAEGESLLGLEDETSAIRKFTELLELTPCDIEACRMLTKAREALIAKCFGEAKKLESAGDLLAAWEHALSIRMLVPDDVPTLTRLVEMRAKLVSDLLEKASELESEGRIEEANAAILDLLKVDFANIQAREKLCSLQESLLCKYLSEAGSALAEDNPDRAVEVLEKALGLRPSVEVQTKLAGARSIQSMGEGLKLYRDKQYSQAAVHFRKALHFDPSNSEAAKYIGYAEKLDESLINRFSKLE